MSPNRICESQFFAVHGKRPRGFGNWWFGPTRSICSQARCYNARYSDARKQALRDFKTAPIVYVLS